MQIKNALALLAATAACASVNASEVVPIVTYSDLCTDLTCVKNACVNPIYSAAFLDIDVVLGSTTCKTIKSIFAVTHKSRPLVVNIDLANLLSIDILLQLAAGDSDLCDKIHGMMDSDCVVEVDGHFYVLPDHDDVIEIYVLLFKHLKSKFCTSTVAVTIGNLLSINIDIDLAGLLDTLNGILADLQLSLGIHVLGGEDISCMKQIAENKCVDFVWTENCSKCEWLDFFHDFGYCAIVDKETEVMDTDEAMTACEHLKEANVLGLVEVEYKPQGFLGGVLNIVGNLIKGLGLGDNKFICGSMANAPIYLNLAGRRQ